MRKGSQGVVLFISGRNCGVTKLMLKFPMQYRRGFVLVYALGEMKADCQLAVTSLAYCVHCPVQALRLQFSSHC